MPSVSKAKTIVPEWPADHVERRPTESLIPYARNAREHDDANVAKIAASIREFGWTIPVLVDEEGTLIAGHGRVLAAQRLGIADVPTMTARGWSEAQIKAYRLTDNRLTLDSKWDDELLRVELGELQGLGFDLGLTGFDATELAGLTVEPEGEPVPEAEAPDDFAEYGEDIETEHECPKCGYAWSGKSGPSSSD